MTDERLLTDFRSSADPAAFERIVTQYGPMVLRVCRDVLGDPHGADDAFQATFLVLAHRADRIRDPSRLGRWLYGVARRVAVRARVRERRRTLRTSAEVPVEVLPMRSAPHDPADLETRPILHEEIDRLPSRLRSAIVLCYMEGLTQEAAASALGCPLGTLKGRLSKGREVLRARLRRRGVAVSSLFLLFLLTEDAPAVPIELAESTSKRMAQSRTVPRWRDAVPKALTWPVGLLTLATVVLMASGAAASAWVHWGQPPARRSASLTPLQLPFSFMTEPAKSCH
jgi:RNA polymerase sigma factor (sigma-70 family)